VLCNPARLTTASCLRFKRQYIKPKIAIAITPIGTPTPIPIFAPVVSPPEFWSRVSRVPVPVEVAATAESDRVELPTTVALAAVVADVDVDVEAEVEAEVEVEVELDVELEAGAVEEAAALWSIVVKALSSAVNIVTLNPVWQSHVMGVPP
jgi:hypothetical protein